MLKKFISSAIIYQPLMALTAAGMCIQLTLALSKNPGPGTPGSGGPTASPCTRGCLGNALGVVEVIKKDKETLGAGLGIVQW